MKLERAKKKKKLEYLNEKTFRDLGYRILWDKFETNSKQKR